MIGEASFKPFEFDAFQNNAGSNDGKSSKKEEGKTVNTSTSQNSQSLEGKPSDYNKPDKVKTEVTRYIRDTKLSKELKGEYEYRCQICGHRIEVPSGSYYVEAHHIRPLGNDHEGPDEKENLIIVCPIHHAELDYGCIELGKDTLQYYKHHFDPVFFEYHNKNIFNKK